MMGLQIGTLSADDQGDDPDTMGLQMDALSGDGQGGDRDGI
jgi:hypothetical protein